MACENRYVNIVCGRSLWQAWHGHDRSGQCDHKTGTRTYISLTDMDIKILRTSQLLCIIRKRILILSHTYREIFKT